MKNRRDTEPFAVLPTALLVKGFLVGAPASVAKVWPLLLLHGRTVAAYPSTRKLADRSGLSVRTVQVALYWIDAGEHGMIRSRERRHRKSTRRIMRVFQLGKRSANFPLFESVADVFRNLSSTAVATYLALRTFAVAEYETDFTLGGFADRRTETLSDLPASTRVAARSGGDRHHIPACCRALISAKLLGQYEDGTWWIAVKVPAFTDD